MYIFPKGISQLYIMISRPVSSRDLVEMLKTTPSSMRTALQSRHNNPYLAFYKTYITFLEGVQGKNSNLEKSGS